MDGQHEIEVESLIGQPSGYERIDRATHRVADEDYIEGAVRLWIGDEQLLAASDWDLIDQLWTYLVDGIEALGLGKPFSTRYPDQPLLVRFDPAGPGQTVVTVEAGGETRSAVADTETLRNALHEEARRFFQNLPRLAPGQASYSQSMLERLEAHG